LKNAKGEYKHNIKNKKEEKRRQVQFSGVLLNELLGSGNKLTIIEGDMKNYVTVLRFLQAAAYYWTLSYLSLIVIFQSPK